jgi:U1 small nuclear ribonucleoprotein 70kDa
LFAPRPPLLYTRPVDKDIDRVTSKNVKTAGLFNAAAEGDGMEEGEEPTYTQRQIRREERKTLKTEQFKIAKETCMSVQSCALHPLTQPP